jgi:predicted AAA+ superfamily ATPase
MDRNLQTFIQQDLEKKMVFLGGPRQVGKTTLAKSLFDTVTGEYFNWDKDADRKALLKNQWVSTSKLLIFDELHKYPRWKTWIKGVYDTKPNSQHILVTGSARLDTYKRGGDSLFGRYHYWRLHPLTLEELPPDISSEEGYRRLLTLGGFPEPFLENNERSARRWRKERFDRILTEDVRDISPIHSLQLLSLFIDMLRERAGSLITLSNIAADLHLSPKTVKEWLSLAEKLYLLFPIYPLTTQIARAIQKPPKVYFYDNADLQTEAGARLENLVATHLLKRLHFLEDYHGHRCQLHYIRDKDGREVDFVTLVDGKVTDLIEVKLTDASISTSLRYYSKRLNPQNAIQLVGNLDRPYDKDGIQVRHPIDFFRGGVK